MIIKIGAITCITQSQVCIMMVHGWWSCDTFRGPRHHTVSCLTQPIHSWSPETSSQSCLLSCTGQDCGSVKIKFTSYTSQLRSFLCTFLRTTHRIPRACACRFAWFASRSRHLWLIGTWSVRRRLLEGTLLRSGTRTKVYHQEIQSFYFRKLLRKC